MLLTINLNRYALLPVLALLVSMLWVPRGAVVATQDVDDTATPAVPLSGADAARSGRMPGALPAGTPEIRWTHLWDGSLSNPIVVGGSVFFLANDPTLKEVHVVSLDAATGAKIWDTVVPSATNQWQQDLAFADGLILTGMKTGLVAFESATGIQRWRFETEAAAATAPLVVGDVVLFATATNHANNLFAVEVRTGAQRWAVAMALVPVRTAAGDGLMFLSDFTPTIRAIDIATGELRWEAVTADGVTRGPVVAHGAVYVGTSQGFGTSQGMVVRLDQRTGQILQSMDVVLDLDDFGIHQIAAGTEAMFVTTEGQLLALDPDTLAIRWKIELGESGPFYAATVGEAVVVSGGTTIQALVAADGTELWVMSGPISGDPIIVDRKIVIKTLNKVVAIGGADDPPFVSAGPETTRQLAAPDAVDRTIVDPAECPVNAITPELFRSTVLGADVTLPALTGLSGTAVKPAIVQVVAERIRQFVACENSGELLRQLTLFSERGLHWSLSGRLFGMEITEGNVDDAYDFIKAASPVATIEYSGVKAAGDVVMYEDGRIGVVVVIYSPVITAGSPNASPEQALRFLLVEEGGRLAIDGIVELSAADAEGLPMTPITVELVSN